MDVNELFKMSSTQLDAYLHSEVNKIIESAPEDKRGRLAAIHNRARLQVAASKNTNDAMVRLNKIMWESLYELKEELNKVSGYDDTL